MNIYCFWTGDNPLTENRKTTLEQLKTVSGANIKLVTKHNLHEYILSEHPLHAAYEYLSETHKADYLRTYFMNFLGGGYSDIKQTSGSWTKCFQDLEASDKWICGFKETDGGVGYGPLVDKWSELIGNCAYICKPGTPLTQEWYKSMIQLLDTKLEKLQQFPSRFPQDCAELGAGYPIEWNEMLGRIFHRVCYTYKEHLLNTLPACIFHNYR